MDTGNSTECLSWSVYPRNSADSCKARPLRSPSCPATLKSTSRQSVLDQPAYSSGEGFSSLHVISIYHGRRVFLRSDPKGNVRRRFPISPFGGR